MWKLRLQIKKAVKNNDIDKLREISKTLVKLTRKVDSHADAIKLSNKKAEARRKFDAEKKRFLEGAAVGDILMAPFTEWLGPELQDRDDGWDMDEVDEANESAKNERCGHWMDLAGHTYHEVNCAHLNISSGDDWFMQDSWKYGELDPHRKGAMAAGDVLLANTARSVLRLLTYGEVLLIRRAWMSVARVTWMAAVVRASLRA